MARSMTGYGSSSFSFEGADYTLEIQSVNRKSLEINMFIPKELLSMDLELRSHIAERLTRGQVICRLSKKVKAYVPNKRVLKRVKDEWEQLAQDLGLNEAITLPFLAEQAGKLSFLEEVDKQTMKKALASALDALLSMRDAEGESLVKEMLGRLSEMEKCLAELSYGATTVVNSYREKLTERLESLKVDGKEERIAFETVLFAEKMDITEELERLNSHLSQFKEGLADDVVGKKLDFLLQEMHREVNTIMSKSGELTVINHGIFMKAEIDKLREQSRNLE